MGFKGVPGHEFVGSVVEGPAEFIGKRVVGEINFGCGRCDACRRDLSRHCPNRSVMGILNADGAFAEFVSVPVDNLHVVPENVSDEEAVFTEPLAAAFEILTQIQLNPGDEVLVLGDGKLGNLVRSGSAAHRREHQRARKTRRQTRFDQESRRANDSTRRLATTIVRRCRRSDGFRFRFGAGAQRRSPARHAGSQKHHRRRAPSLAGADRDQRDQRDRFALRAISRALDALAAKQVSVTPLIENIYSLNDGLAAISHAARPGARKILLRPS